MVIVSGPAIGGRHAPVTIYHILASKVAENVDRPLIGIVVRESAAEGRVREADISLQAGTDRLERLFDLALVRTREEFTDLVVVQSVRVRDGEFVRTTLEEHRDSYRNDTENLNLIVHNESIL